MEAFFSADFLYMEVVWGPVLFSVFFGLGLLASGIRSLQSLSFAIPAAWAILDFGIVMLTAIDGKADHELIEVALLRAAGIAGVTVFFLALYGAGILIDSMRKKRPA